MALDTISSLTDLLENSRKRLSQPFANKQRKLLIYLNSTYLLLCPIFLISERLSTGHYVPHIALGYVYFFVGLTNFLSLIYNNFLLNSIQKIKLAGKVIPIIADTNLDVVIRWASVLSIMAMSFLNMSGFGNPSNDSILSDFAFGHSLIVLEYVGKSSLAISLDSL